MESDKREDQTKDEASSENTLAVEELNPKLNSEEENNLFDFLAKVQQSGKEQKIEGFVLDQVKVWMDELDAQKSEGQDSDK
eukprot:CAMPEP_0115022558 /NCGR_PEP_ID=MMETSP0216-20121206/31641_1 /TAXON_ID=223996 /ORGANISM="Protocruzia adherens, Strain Boccale" /LENGTH=80 /DNA_ID=CAMNT_0002395303 /DNA_START=31 /DNA_END=273 /DNA_ORIENTATION=-